MSVYDYERYLKIRPTVKLMLLSEFRKRGVPPPGWINEMADVVAADIVLTGSSIKKRVKDAVDAWIAVLEEKAAIEADLRRLSE